MYVCSGNKQYVSLPPRCAATFTLQHVFTPNFYLKCMYVLGLNDIRPYPLIAQTYSLLQHIFTPNCYLKCMYVLGINHMRHYPPRRTAIFTSSTCLCAEFLSKIYVSYGNKQYASSSPRCLGINHMRHYPLGVQPYSHLQHVFTPNFYLKCM